jgi:hypothetical protein
MGWLCPPPKGSEIFNQPKRVPPFVPRHFLVLPVQLLKVWSSLSGIFKRDD